MTEHGRTSAAEYLPERKSLAALHAAQQCCRGCDLYQHATQAVSGAGPAHARMALVGEMPGDEEDRAGAPFVGPAGALLDKSLAQAGIDRSEVFITNAVKHFKWEPRGKKRLHKKPSAREASACHPWLEAEIAIVRPRVIVCLGATAAQALLGRKFRLTERHGEVIDHPWGSVVSTYHPAAVLRAPDPAARHTMSDALVADLRAAIQRLVQG